MCPQVQKKTVDACRSYLELPHFNREVIYTKSHAAAGMCDWAVRGAALLPSAICHSLPWLRGAAARACAHQCSGA